MKVNFLLEKEYAVASPFTGISAIEDQLLRRAFVVVMDGNTFKGILTPADLVQSAHNLVIDCLHDKPVVDAETDLTEILPLMDSPATRILPVFSRQNFVGVIRQQKIIEYLAAYQQDLEQEVARQTRELQQYNEQLQAEIEQRKEFEAQLQEALHEKELLLQEIHHRVKNNLQVVSSIVQLQAHHIADKKIRSHLLDIQNRINSMKLIHQQLYEVKDFSGINFTEYLRSIATELYQSYQVDRTQIPLRIIGEPVYLNLDTAIPCSLLVTEILANSLKHAFPVPTCNSEIMIKLSAATDYHYTLIISDNGVGLPDSALKIPPTTLGMKLINGLVNQLKGRLEILPGSGTTYQIHLQRVTKEEKRWPAKGF